ncbi:hypothetical protein DLM45_14020 [Hyphomicrobium methylovorum]|uniref:hypothetical protein n=1 Tax=Hyphomicrobium methylovorum TaxID=84 RepID=UPI0015E73BDB|nr:hypothetical protein [Hyphomicrobium methylovorum]MBA2127331.1 hypothetical protein [Hyphomicrobium methylovorum]
MPKAFLAALALALSTTFAFAAEDSNITTKAMKDHPGTMGGSTSNATAKPNSGSLSEKQMQEQPGVNGDTSGSTSMPNAKPDDGSIANKEMHDHSGAHK